MNVFPVILCGGSGTRLWPLSRSGFPKQFLCLTGAQSLFQLAIERVRAIQTNLDNDCQLASPIIVTHEDHRFLAMEQLREINVINARAILEPQARNTAPALTLAALLANDLSDKDSILVVTPADQIVEDSSAFAESLIAAICAAKDQHFALLGIKPDRPETGYGYIHTGLPAKGVGIHSVQSFVEKPPAEKAQQYLAQGGYYWNAGIFVVRASLWLSAIARHRNELFTATQASWQLRQSENLSPDSPFATFYRPDGLTFSKIHGESVDYAVLEPESRAGHDATPISMVPLFARWSDLGSWDALWQNLPKDAQNNHHHGDVIAIESERNLVFATSRLVSVVGLSDVVVVESPDAVLVSSAKHAQSVKKVVDTLCQQRREEQSLHRKVHRPWGWYDSIDEGSRFKVKRIMVKPKASLSLQKHHHRAEHWVVVQGTAEITCGNQVQLLSENQSTYIPLGEIHRLTNPGTIPLEIIEVQSGSYLGEDDIVRMDDQYGRQ